ncbi:hypothetical protein CPLU01_03013 [Colletotrichum plurivorum]|uniref:Uncharacterized protein n=1 Tax=Colletotrichum plurivorum TaxID=2175906 RepID=A0A8H6KUS0_9PEZI|nr:hypothetical protein CPLU01_03013 [Colletotrichum plurivorum]
MYLPQTAGGVSVRPASEQLDGQRSASECALRQGTTDDLPYLPRRRLAYGISRNVPSQNNATQPDLASRTTDADLPFVCGPGDLLMKLGVIDDWAGKTGTARMYRRSMHGMAGNDTRFQVVRYRKCKRQQCQQHQQEKVAVGADAVDDIGVGGQEPPSIPEGGMEMEPTHMGDDGGVDNISWAHPYAVGSPSFPQGWTSRGATNQGRESKEEVGGRVAGHSQREQLSINYVPCAVAAAVWTSISIAQDRSSRLAWKHAALLMR